MDWPLATEPERSARHRQARAAGELALELGRTAELLQALLSRRRGSADRKPRLGTAPEVAG